MLGKTAQKRFKRKEKKGMAGPGPASNEYKGAIKVDNRNEQCQMVNLFGVTNGQVTNSGSSGSFSTVFTAGSVTSATDWSTYSGLFQEFRVLGMKVDYKPVLDGSVLLVSSSLGMAEVTNCDVHYMAPYHGDATAFTGATNAFSHAGVKVRSINKPLGITVRMSESDESQWNSTTSGTAAIFGVKTWWNEISVDPTPVIRFGTYLVTWNVQFRTRVASATQLKRDVKDIKEKKEDKKDMVNSDVKFSGELSLPAPLKNKEPSTPELYVTISADEYEIMKKEKEKKK